MSFKKILDPLGLFGGGEKAPALPAPAPIPTRADPEIARAREEARLSRLRSQGRKANILTSPLGATDAPSQVTRRAALGDVR